MGAVLMKTVHAADTTQFVLEAGEEENLDSLSLQLPAVVKAIHISGLSKTKNEIITNQLNQLFNAKTFDKVMSESHLGKLKLERLGIFSAIHVLVDVSKDGGKNDFDVHYVVTEKRFLSANVGTNVGANEGDMTMSTTLNNMRGVAEMFRGSISFGTRVSSAYELSFTKPSVADSDERFTVRALKCVSDMKQSLYKENAKGIGFDFQIPSKLGVHNLAYNCMWRENKIDGAAPFDVREQAGHNLKSSLKHVFTSDGRDDWIFPSSGHLLKHSIEYSGLGGNVRAVKSDLELQFNKEIFADIVLALSLQTGIARSLSTEPLLINDRHFLGGPVSVRGFATKGIGKHAGNASLGGEMFCASGLHVYTPLPFRPGQGGFGDMFRLHLFLNAGNLSDISNLNVGEFLRNSRYSYGMGLMLMLGGIARLEVNYCIPRNIQDGDIVNKGLQVGVGMNFL